MKRSRNSKYLDLSRSAEMTLILGARDAEPVKGLTHSYYKYPARFSPVFARAAIETFTQPGDLCLDPHVGGGTSIVEALALGRHAVGVDISALAEFVSTVKTIVFSDTNLDQLESWKKYVCNSINIHRPSIGFADYADLGYYKHLKHPNRWRLRKAIEQALDSATRLDGKQLQSFGRCAVLRTAQWALDGRAKQATVEAFRNFLENIVSEMVEGARALRAAVRSHGLHTSIQVINRSAVGLEEDARLNCRVPPKLVITSPPYPGVHVLYHRWQVDGRKETALPFMIAGKLDGAGASHYTMGDRQYPELKTYFENIRRSMSSVSKLANDETIVVQMVAFAEPGWQLQRYLDTMKEAGLREVFLPSLRGHGDGRLWRSVPGRRWYSDQRGETPGSNEVVLFHRKAIDSAASQPASPMNHALPPRRSRNSKVGGLRLSA